ncbi:MAG: hypothetical protein R6X33_05995 [Candidatus Brocadiia bacterium]
MSRGKWMVLAVVAATLLAVPAMLARGEDMPPEARARMERRERALHEMRRKVDTLREAGRMFQERGMQDMAQMMRERAADLQAELEKMQEPVRPERRMMQMGGMARRHTEMLEGLTEGQEQIKRHLCELSEQVQVLRKEVRALREQRGE